MQALNRSMQTVPKILLGIGLLKRTKPVLEDITLLFRGKFCCKNASNIAREFTYRKEFKLDSAGKNTLQSRILEYFRTNSKYTIMTSSSRPRPTSASFVMQEDKPLKKHLTDIPSLDHCQLAGFLRDIHHQSFMSSMDETQFIGLVSFLDEECCDRIGIMTPKDVSTMLDAWMHWIPNRITHLKFYYCFLKQMKRWLTDPHLPVEDFIKLTFYIGLGKKSHNVKNIMYLVTDVVEGNIDLRSLSIVELCIVSNAFYKAGTKMTPKLLATVNDAIIKNFAVLVEDPALFVTLVKAIRQAQNYDYKLLDVVSNKMLSNESAIRLLGFTAKSHILAWYACTLYERLDILSLLVQSSQKDLTRSSSNQFLQTTESDHLSIRYRSKDLCRFLWSLCNLNYTSELECVESTIIPELRNRFKRGDYIEKPHEIIDSLLSLWILGFKVGTLLADVVSSENLAILGKKNRLYYNSRLALLLTCASIEAPGILTNDQLSLKDSFSVIHKPKLGKYMTTRPLLKKVYSIVCSLSDVLKASNVSCKFVIPHLNIAGIKVEMESHPVYIELLDPTVCLYKSEKPHGLMQLKLRLMESLHYHVIAIEGHEIEKRIDDLSSLYEYIEERIFSTTTQRFVFENMVTLDKWVDFYRRQNGELCTWMPGVVQGIGKNQGVVKKRHT